MLMVIFGAGASYDSAQAFRPNRVSAGEEVWRPPLAKDLFRNPHHAFGDIVRNYPKLTHILPYLREPSRGTSVEEVLESLQQEGPNDPERQRELTSVRFYLCELLDKITREWIKQTDRVTNYAPLIADILRFNASGEEVCLVTFNYDLLLEDSLYTFGFKGRDPEDYLDSHPTLKLFKLHGSVDWSRFVEVGPGGRVRPETLIEHAQSIRLSDKFVRAIATNPHQMFGFDRPIFPAIAIPVQTKSEQSFECPRSHIDYLTNMLPHITKILIVGWQAREAHFLRMLHSKLPRLKHLMVVGANQQDARNTYGLFCAELGLIRPTEFVALRGFTDFIVNREGHPFFLQP